tara:strand:- start:683 stop:988 length:306 start_codon:yes stop_codon:yes gene_type:complete
VLFGLVVTLSVKMVGILLVFSFLVIPILAVFKFTQLFWVQVKWAWLLGVVSTILGLILSVVTDIPPSFSIILVLIATWLISVGVLIGCQRQIQQFKLKTVK